MDGSYLIASAFGLIRSGTAFVFLEASDSPWSTESIDTALMGAIACTFATVATVCREVCVFVGALVWTVIALEELFGAATLGGLYTLRLSTTVGLVFPVDPTDVPYTLRALGACVEEGIVEVKAGLRAGRRCGDEIGRDGC